MNRTGEIPFGVCTETFGDGLLVLHGVPSKETLAPRLCRYKMILYPGIRDTLKTDDNPPWRTASILYLDARNISPFSS
jgi:hypothetical protein